MANSQNTALLVMDVQQGIANRYTVDDPSRLDPFKKAAESARANNIPVIFVRVAFREGFPEVSSNNKMFSTIASNGGMTEAVSDIVDAVKPLEDEPIVTKRRVSAFTGSDLEVILRAKQINKLVLTGIATSGVVLSTLREASDKDYQLTVLSDACLDGDEEVHRVLTTKVFPRQAEVMTVDEWSEIL